MAFDATKFRDSFSKSTEFPTASSAYFEAYFTELPDNVAFTNRHLIKALQNMKFRCSAVDLPSRQMVSIQRAFNAPHKLVPYSSIYSSTVVEFIETSDFEIRTFFDTWQKLIDGSNRNFVTQYYDHIVAPEFIVLAYNKSGKQTHKWKFKNVFPVSVNPSQMNWNSQNSIVTVSVELSYQYWEDVVVK